MTLPEPIFAHLSDVAYLMNCAQTTIRSDWKQRVRDGLLPPPLPNHKRPTWLRSKLIAHLERDTVPTPSRRPHGNGKAEKASREADALAALMANNRSHAA